MKRKHLGWILLLGWMANPGLEAQGKLSLESTTFDFGEVNQGEIVVASFPVTNSGDSSLSILEVLPAKLRKTYPSTLAPGESGVLDVWIPTERRVGLVADRLKIRTEPAISLGPLSVRGFIHSPFIPEKTRVDLPVVARSDLAGYSFDLYRTDEPALQVSSIKSPSYLRVEVGEAADPTRAGRNVTITLLPSVPLGVLSEEVILRTENSTSPTYRIEVVANVFEDLLPSVSKLEFGAVAQGEPKTLAVQFTSRSGEPAELDSIEVDHPRVSTEVQDCDEPKPSCIGVKVQLTPEKIGPFSGILKFTRKNRDESFEMVYGGLVVAPKTVIHELEVPKTAESFIEPPKSVPAKNSSPQPKTKSPDTWAPVLKWSASDEKGIYGYLVNRAESRRGPFIRVNEKIVRVRQDEDEIHRYQFVDQAAKPGNTYYYFLDVVTTSGLKAPFSTVIARTVDASATTKASEP